MYIKSSSRGHGKFGKFRDWRPSSFPGPSRRRRRGNWKKGLIRPLQTVVGFFCWENDSEEDGFRGDPKNGRKAARKGKNTNCTGRIKNG